MEGIEFRVLAVHLGIDRRCLSIPFATQNFRFTVGLGTDNHPRPVGIGTDRGRFGFAACAVLACDPRTLRAHSFIHRVVHFRRQIDALQAHIHDLDAEFLAEILGAGHNAAN